MLFFFFNYYNKTWQHFFSKCNYHNIYFLSSVGQCEVYTPIKGVVLSTLKVFCIVIAFLQLSRLQSVYMYTSICTFIITEYLTHIIPRGNLIFGSISSRRELANVSVSSLNRLLATAVWIWPTCSLR